MALNKPTKALVVRALAVSVGHLEIAFGLLEGNLRMEQRAVELMEGVTALAGDVAALSGERRRKTRKPESTKARTGSA